MAAPMRLVVVAAVTLSALLAPCRLGGEQMAAKIPVDVFVRPGPRAD